MSRPAWVKIFNSTIKKNVYVVTNHDGHFPVFSMIIDVLVLCDIVVLHVCHCKTDFFDDHYHAYAVLLSHDQSYIRFVDVLYFVHIKKRYFIYIDISLHHNSTHKYTSSTLSLL